jgi:hypothetical protein
MYEFMQTTTGWLVYWGPVPAGMQHTAAQPRAVRQVARVSREQLAAATVRVPYHATVATTVAAPQTAHVETTPACSA